MSTMYAGLFWLMCIAAGVMAGLAVGIYPEWLWVEPALFAACYAVAAVLLTVMQWRWDAEEAHDEP